MKENTVIKLALHMTVVTVMTSCDATIHEYPEPVSDTVTAVLEASVSREPPGMYKTVVYDQNWNRSERKMPEDSSANGWQPGDGASMRIIMEIYSGEPQDDGSTRSTPSERLLRRVLTVDKDALPPQDTVRISLPDGEYHILAWADYVYEGTSEDLCYRTDSLTAVRTDIVSYPDNTMYRSGAAGRKVFSLRMTKDGDTTERINIDMQRPLGRYRVVASDYEDFLRSGGSLEGMTVEVVYRQYISIGYNVATDESNAFISSYSFDIRPSEYEYDGILEASLFGDYLFTSADRETVVIADFHFSDASGKEISHCEGIEIPLWRNCETVIVGCFLTSALNDGGGVDIDEGFDDEYIVGID